MNQYYALPSMNGALRLSANFCPKYRKRYGLIIKK